MARETGAVVAHQAVKGCRRQALDPVHQPNGAFDEQLAEAGDTTDMLGRDYDSTWS